MEKINDFINHRLPENFMFDDDYTIEKLQGCIEKLQRHRFDTGPLLDIIPPPVEMPTMPFGDLNKLSQQDLIAQIQTYHKHKHSVTLDRDAHIEQIANERLNQAKKLRAERKQARMEERKQLAMMNEDAGNLEKLLVNSHGKPIRNISDSDDDDDDEEDFNGRLDSSDDENEDYNSDDLNPSKISEYDDDKLDKESMLSNITHDSTPFKTDMEHARSKSPTLNKMR